MFLEAVILASDEIIIFFVYILNEILFVYFVLN